MSTIAIIGSGMGGLTAGCLLAAKGHKVTIFESHTTPGGYTAGFHREGFYFESGTLAFESSRQVFAAMKKIGVYDKIDFVPFHSRFLAPEFDIIASDYGRFKQEIKAAFAADAGKLDAYFSAVEPLVRSMQGVMLGSGAAKLRGGLGMLKHLMRYRNTTITDFTARYFDRGSRLFNLFKGFGYPDMSAAILGGAVVTIFNDYWLVKSGMQSWADIIAARFTALGGQLQLKTRVQQIKTKNGRATGVIAGEREYAADWVISACDYKKTFLQLLDDPRLVPGPQMEKIKNNAVSEGIFTVYLGLDIGQDELERALRLPHVMYLDEQPGTDIRNPHDADYFNKSGFSLFSPSLQNPALAPANRSSLMIQVGVPYHWQDNWGGGDRSAYRALKTKAMDTLIARVGHIIPNLGQKIVFKDAATPLTYEHFTGNTDGATSAWSWNPRNKFYKSILKSYVTTPVPRLLIGSCWASQIGGIPGALGAAEACGRIIGA